MPVEKVRLVIFSGRVKIYVGRGDMVIFPMRANSTYPPLDVDFFFDNGDEITLSDFTTVTVSVRRLGGIEEEVLAATAMTLTGGGNPNNATYQWGAGFRAGTYVADFYFDDEKIAEQLFIPVSP